METLKLTQRKLKIFPGRGLDGKGIKARLNNRTLEGMDFGDDQYTIDEDLNAFTKMSRVQQIEHMRMHNSKIANLQKLIEVNQKKADEKAISDRINREVEKRISQQQKSNNEKTQ